MQDVLQKVLRRHVEAENAHDMAGTLATLHADCVFEDTATEQVFRGRAGAERYYRLWWNAFGLRFERADGDSTMWTEDGGYAAQARFVGRHDGEFLGIPPTGKVVVFRFAVFVTFRDGLMSGEKFYYDLMGLMRQIGEPAWRGVSQARAIIRPENGP